MIRIHQSTSSADAKRYYTQGLNRTDYYTRDGETPGVWFGEGAKRLQLEGEVGREDFFALLDNRNPIDGERLTVRNLGDQRRPGWDVVFSPPKSVSMLRVLTGDDRIREALLNATKDTLAEIETEAITTRIRRDGQYGNTPTGNLIASLFFHDTTRALADGYPDPHDHIHAFIHNATWSEAEQRYQAVDTYDLHIDRPYYEAAFEARLASRLTHLGYGIERIADGWEIAGITRGMIDCFSRRTSEIEAVAKEHNITDATDRGQLGARTRRKKESAIEPELLQRYWEAKLTPAEAKAIDAIRQQAQNHPTKAKERLGPNAEEALRHAIKHHFTRASTATTKQLLATALRYSVGSTTPEALQSQLAQEKELLFGGPKHRPQVTTPEALKQEEELIAMARAGRGRCDPLSGYQVHAVQREFLNKDQRNAIQHLLGSFDRIMLLRGLAGVGKSTALEEVREGIEKQGRGVLAVAPTTGAVNVLRENNFQAETIAHLLKNDELQGKLKNNVLLVDEAGLVGVPTMHALFRLAERHNARVILSGDSKQHRAVERGTALRLLENRAGLRSARITEILRQRGSLKDAVQALAEGNSEVGLKKLDALGSIEEIGDDVARYRQLAIEYADTLARGKEALAIAPTHAEGAKVTEAIRDVLRQRGVIKDDQHTFTRLENTNLTDAQKQDAVHYQPGDVLQFFQNAKGGWKRSDRATVLSHDKDTLHVRTASGNEKLLPLNLASRFQHYRPRSINLASGDAIRFTLNGQTPDKKRLTNGGIAHIAGFTDAGDIRLANGWVVPKDFGHLTPGWVVTSHASQGKTVKGTVFIAQSTESLPASSREQFYVSASRAKDKVRVFTDDKEALQRAVARTDQPQSAIELMEPRQAKQNFMATIITRLHRLHYLARIYARMGFERVREPSRTQPILQSVSQGMSR